MSARPSLEVRPARPRDAAAISFLLRVAFAEITPFYTPEALAETLPDVDALRRRMAEGTVWIAVSGTEPVGTLSAVLGPEGVHLRSMAVHPAARGRGVARALLGEAERYARGGRQRRMFLRTTPFSSTAIGVYARAGFTPCESARRDLHGIPLFEMEKRLGTPRRNRPGRP